MRIIAGSARRLPLKTVEGRDTRPTSDRIKDTLFNILSPSLPGCRFLDLFAGSGQMGLEAASRGAKDVVLVENSRKAAACIEGNISFTKLGDSCTLLVMDAALAVRRMEGQEPFDVIFMDPPYHKGLEQGILEALSVSSLVGEDTEIVAESPLDTDFSYAEGLGYQITREKIYKTNKHVFLHLERQCSGRNR